MIRFRRSNDGSIFVPSRGRPPAEPEGYVRDPRNPFRFLPEIVPDTASDQELYQHLYNNPLLKYGDAGFNRCPGVRFLPLYEDYLEGSIFDFGCGRGHVVELLRRKGHVASGMDLVDLNNDMLVGDITQPLQVPYDTAICIDVFEHLTDEQLSGLLTNMARAKKQVISVHTGRAFEQGVKRDLHINKKTFDVWKTFINQVLKVERFERTGRQRGLYFCTSR